MTRTRSKSNLDEIPVIEGILRRIGFKKTVENKKEIQFLGSMLEHSSLPFYTGSPDGSIITCNSAFCQLTGYTKEELRTVTWNTDLTPPWWRESEAKVLEKLRSTGNPQRYEKEYICKDGSQIPVELFVHLGCDEGAFYYYSFVTDITHRKKAEEALRKGEIEHRLLLDSIQSPVVALNEDMTIRSCNDAYAAFVGRSTAELEGKNMLELFPEFTKTQWYTACLRVLATKRMQEAEGVLGRHDVRTQIYHTPRGVLSIIKAANHNQVEEALQESEEPLKTIMESVNDVIFQLSPSFYITYVTPNVKSYGYEPEELIGNYFKKTTPENEVPKALKALESVLSGKTVRNFEIDQLDSDGNIVRMEINFAPVKKEGKIVGVQGVMRDITDRKQVEEKLHQSEERFRTIVETAPSLLLISDAEGNNTYVSPNCEEITGYTQEELLGGMRWWVHADDTPKARNLFDRTLTEGVGGKHFEYKAVKKNGDIWYASSSWKPLKDENGKFKGVVLQTIDITEQKQAEEMLRESEEKYRDLVENMNDVIYTADRNGVVTYVSPAIESFIRYEPSEVIGRHFAEFIYDKDLPRLKESFQHILSGSIKANEYRIVAKSGEIRWIRTSSRPIIVGDCVVGVQGVVADITERKKAEEKLRYRLDFEELITTISTHFINLNPDKVDQGIHLALEKIGRFTGADRSYVFLVHDNGTTMDNTHEWCAEGVEPQKDQLQGLEVEAFKWGIDQLKSLEVLNIPRIADLPREARADREILQAGGIQSLLSVPIFIGGVLFGFFGLDSVGTERTWSDDTALMLKIVAEIFANALERKRAEEMLRESEKKFRELADLLPQTVFEVDLEGNITYTNRYGFESSGYTQEDINKGLNIIQLAVPEDRERARQNIQKVLKGIEVEDHEYTVLKKDGSTFPVLIYSSPIIRDGKPAGLRGILLDITERKQAEEQVKASLKEKEVLLREIHHRVKNNLQVISSLLNLQAEHMGDSQYTEILKESQDRIKSMALIHEKLYQSENLADINFSEYVTSLVHALVRSYEAAERISLVIEVDDVSLGVDAAIPCGLIINELVSNALKHAFPGDRKGVISVTLHSIHEIVELTVQDNGVGIPEDVDFKNVESLGLDLVTTLARQQLDGEITLDRGNGTKFCVTFKEVKQ